MPGTSWRSGWPASRRITTRHRPPWHSASWEGEGISRPLCLWAPPQLSWLSLTWAGSTGDATLVQTVQSNLLIGEYTRPIKFTCSFARSWLITSAVQVQCQILTFHVGSPPVTRECGLHKMSILPDCSNFAFRAVGYAHDMTVRMIIGPLSNWCARRFGNEGAAVLEEVAADLGVLGGRSERPDMAPRYGPPPGSAPVARGPALPAENLDKPSTSAFVSRMLHRPNVDSQAAQLAEAELQLAIRNALVSSLFIHVCPRVETHVFCTLSLGHRCCIHCIKGLEFPFEYTAKNINSNFLSLVGLLLSLNVHVLILKCVYALQCSSSGSVPKS
jgi:hypothetical protein